MTKSHMHILYCPEQQQKDDFHQVEFVDKSTWKLKTPGGILLFRVLVQVGAGPAYKQMHLYVSLIFEVGLKYGMS